MTEENVDSHKNNTEKKDIVAAVSRCVTPDCIGWLTDVFAGKYLIRCMDPKHNTTLNHMALPEEVALKKKSTKSQHYHQDNKILSKSWCA